MKTVSWCLNGVLAAGLGVFAGCDKDVDLGDAAETGSQASGEGDHGEGDDDDGNEDESASATSTSGSSAGESSGESGDGSTTTAGGDALEGEFYFAESETGWPAYHLVASGGTYEMTDAYFDIELEEWSTYGDPMPLADVEYVDNRLQFTATVDLDGLEGVLVVDLNNAEGVLCGTIAFGYGNPGSPVPAWGFDVDAGVENPMAECVPG